MIFNIDYSNNNFMDLSYSKR